MRRRFLFFAPLFAITTVFAQTTPLDPQMTQTLLAEVRQLRQDLQTAAATIQRVQIVMYRLQNQTMQLDRATQRLDDARGRCKQAQMQKVMITTEIEQAEARHRNTPNQQISEATLAQFKASLEAVALEEKQCQAEQFDAEGRFRGEEVKTRELQDQLDKLDRVLAAYGAR